MMRKQLLEACRLAYILSFLILTGCKESADDVIVNPTALTMDSFYTGYINSEEVDDGVVWSWSLLPENIQMDIVVTQNGQPYCRETTRATSIVQKKLDTNVRYDYQFRLYDGVNYSDAIQKTYTRQGATKIKGLNAKQQESGDDYEIVVSWSPAYDASDILIRGTNGTRQIEETLNGKSLDYVVEHVNKDEQWTFELIACNEKGISLPVTLDFKTGKEKVAFLSIYPTAEDCLANGDDDEASAWLWFHEEYPNSRFLYAGDIKSADNLASYRVLFYIRDLDKGSEDDVWNQPACMQQATPFIQEWYKEGGNLVLWQHAVTYITDLGRMDRDVLRGLDHRVTIGGGSWNDGIWHMAVQLNPGSYFVRDFSSHPIYNNVDVRTSGRSKYVAVKGPAWTEDHNVVFHGLPSLLTGYSDKDPRCYEALTEVYGIYPLGVWDSQIDWVSQLNIWEARQGNTAYKGTILCIGNGGCEFSYKNADGTSDICAYPRNSCYQSNVMKIAKNSIEYLKTR